MISTDTTNKLTFPTNSSGNCAPSKSTANPSVEVKPFVVVPSRCSSHFCSSCGGAKSRELRGQLAQAISSWTKVMMIPLTLDQKKFGSGEDAFLFVREKRAIGRFVRELKRKKIVHCSKYFASLEFHANGYPHWHILIDHSQELDNSLLHGLWFQVLGLEVLERVSHASVHTKRYDVDIACQTAIDISAYVTKRVAAPNWVLDFEGQVRKYTTSKNFFSRKRRQTNLRKERSNLSAVNPNRVMKTLRQKTSRCRKGNVKLLQRLPQKYSSGADKCRFKSELPFSIQEVCKILGISEENRVFIDRSELNLLNCARTRLRNGRGSRIRPALINADIGKKSKGICSLIWLHLPDVHCQPLIHRSEVPLISTCRTRTYGRLFTERASNTGSLRIFSC